MSKLAVAAMVVMGAAAGMAQAQEVSAHERCLLRQLAEAAPGATVAQLQAACAEPLAKAATPAASAPDSVPEPVLTQRLKAEEASFGNRYVLTPHRINYVLPFTYLVRRPDSSPYRQDLEDTENKAQKVENKFQLSFKFPLLLNAFGGSGDLFAGYTQRSFWQMYNNQASKPFRETNYEPEVWFQQPIGMSLGGGWSLLAATIGIDHQSNGRGEAFSRSWNRVTSSLVFENGQYAVALRPWWRVPEDRSNDDNPDISHYMGNFDLFIGRKFGPHSFDFTLRNNLQTRNNRGAYQLGWSFPLPYSSSVRGYVQAFTGYGESLIDYNVRQTTFGVGLQLADW